MSIVDNRLPKIGSKRKRQRKIEIQEAVLLRKKIIYEDNTKLPEQVCEFKKEFTL